jgi:V8-like Glu-specific endopeptidase
MLRFQVEGFRYVGKRVLVPPKSQPKGKAPTGQTSFGPKDKPFRAIRITRTGDEYISDWIQPSESSGLEEMAPSHRDLKVIGDDTRMEIVDATPFPYRIVGQLEFTDDPFFPLISGTCSGTLVNTNKVMTAGHCVYDDNAFEWYSVTGFFPGRHRPGGVGLATDPFGRKDWELIQIHQNYADGLGFEWDFAIITLTEDTGLGYAGYRETTLESPHLQKSRVIGYPGEKPYGSIWVSQHKRHLCSQLFMS